MDISFVLLVTFKLVMAQIKVQEKYHKKGCFHEMLEFFIRNIATFEFSLTGLTLLVCKRKKK